MKLKPVIKSWLWILFMAGFLLGCETEKMQQTENGMQQNYLLQSLELVESAGQILQSPSLNQADIDKAMVLMDRGLEQAYQVKRKFLAKLDARLPKIYSEFFIPGIENYRIGVESSDREVQLKGLDLLNRWGQYWAEQKPVIQQALIQING